MPKVGGSLCICLAGVSMVAIFRSLIVASMKICLSLATVALCACAASMPARGQIFGGVSASHTLVLSNVQDEKVTEVIVPAPLDEVPQPLGTTELRKPPKARPLASPFAGFIEEASRLHGLPSTLISAVIAVESNFNPKAVSPKGAQGLMQLMPTTARRFNAGDALDPRQNILAGSRYLRWLLSYFHQDLPLALAAYNAGEGAVVNAGYRIPQNAETLRYVPSVLALYRGTSGAM